MPMVGGTGEVREADEHIHQITGQVKDQVQAQSGRLFEEFVALKYKSQLVNGTNYFIKVRSGPNEHVHLRVHKSFQGEVTLAAFQLDKAAEEEIAYFQ